MENQTKPKIEFSGRWWKRQEGLDLQNDQHRASFLRANLERTRAKLHARLQQTSTKDPSGEDDEQNEEPSRQTCVISKAEERGISLPQMNDVYDLIKRHSSRWLDWHGNQLQLPPEAMNLYHTADNLIKPSTKEHECSYVETIATGSQMPVWFLSHWWGEVFSSTVTCVTAHSRLHKLSRSQCIFWICAFANNQWKLDAEIQADPSKTSFYLALRASIGVLMVLDPQGKVATRVWCCYETGCALDMHKDGKKFEMATLLPDGSAVVISDGVTAEDEEQGKELRWEHVGGEDGHKADRERHFPMEIAEKLLSTLLQNGQASVEEDCTHILNSLAGQPLDAVPLSDHPSYDALNTKLHFRVGMAVYEAAAAAKSLDRLGLRELAAPEDWDVGLIYYHMGGAFHSQSKLGLAADLLEKALSYREATLGKTHDDTLSTALSLAWVFTNKCEFDRALVLFEEVAAAQKEEYGEGSSEYAKTLSSMGVVYLRKGDLDRAAELFEEYADIIKEVHGERSQSYGTSLVCTAQVLKNKGDHSRALAMLQQACGIFEETCGRQDPEYGNAILNVGDCHNAQGELDQALEAYTQVGAGWQAAFGEGSVQCACVNARSASVQIKKGELDCALQLLQGAPSVLEATMGKQSEFFFLAAVYLSVVHQKKGELGDAQHWLSEATAEFDLKPAVAKAVQLWAMALGHLAHNEVEQAVEIMQQVALDFDALRDYDCNVFAKFVRELAVQFSNRSLDAGAQDKSI